MEGRAAALFVLLAGVGFAMARNSRATILARAAVLFVFGMANMILFDADILHYYALYLLVGLAFVNAPPRRLVAAAIALGLAALCGLILLDYDRGWTWDTLTYQDFWTLPGFLRHSLFNGWHPVLPWAAFFLVGMWVVHQRLDNRRTQARLFIWGLVMSVSASGPLQSAQGRVRVDRACHNQPDPAEAALYGGGDRHGAGHPVGNPAADGPAPPAAPVRWMAQTGRQALTLYIAHIYIGMGTMEALGWLDGRLDPAGIFWISAGFILLSVVYAMVWHRIASRGPLEALLRSVSRRLAG